MSLQKSIRKNKKSRLKSTKQKQLTKSQLFLKSKKGKEYKKIKNLEKQIRDSLEQIERGEIENESQLNPEVSKRLNITSEEWARIKDHNQRVKKANFWNGVNDILKKPPLIVTGKHLVL